MTDATLTAAENAAEAAAIPTAIAIIDAFNAFVVNLGTDPAQVALKFPGAAQVFVGTVEMQAPALIQAEFGAAISVVTSRTAAWKALLQAKLAALSAPAA